MKVSLALLFFITALLYASVGFGGGSSYTALLVVFGADYIILPMISLICNILVVSGNTWRYGRAGLLSMAEIWPFLLLSIPCAWLGGRISVDEHWFTGLLALSLLCAGLAIFFGKSLSHDPRANSFVLSTLIGSTLIGSGLVGSALVGSALGFLSGIVGIGGGIFLAPILHLTRWGKPKEIAALCSLFILVNSLSGLAGQMTKLHGLGQMHMVLPYWPLAIAVVLGGTIGNRWSLKILSETHVRRMTAILILCVGARLLMELFF